MSSNAARLVVLIISLVLAACKNHFPTQIELEAKRQLKTALRGTLLNLPQANDFAVAKVYGRQTDDIFYSGNFKGIYAFLDAKYYSNLEPDVICNMYREFIDRNAIWKRKYHTEKEHTICTTRRDHAYSSAYIGADKIAPPNTRERFHLDISITAHDRNWMNDGKSWRSWVKISLFYTVDHEKLSLCVPEEGRAHLRWPCEGADWGEY